MNTAKAIEMFRTLPADEHPGGLAECAALVLAELDRRGVAIEHQKAAWSVAKTELDRRAAAIERVRELCAAAKPGRPTLQPSVFVADVLRVLDGP